jgi:hypothetical protein
MIIRGKYIGHFCLWDIECWRNHWRYGMPMRLHIGKRFWTIPFLNGNRRSKKVWKQNEYYQRDSATNEWVRYTRADENSEWVAVKVKSPLERYRE